MLFYPCSMTTTTTTVVKVACDIAVYCTICFAIHLLLHTRSLQIEIRCPSGAEPSGRISGLQTALAREDGNIVSDASFDLTAIWTERSCSSSVVTGHHRVERKSSPLLYMVRKLYRSMDVMNGLYIQSNHYLWPV